MQQLVLDSLSFEDAKNGNTYAFEVLIKQYEKLFFNIAYRITNNYEDAKDVTQDSLIKIYKNLNSCLSFEMFKNWGSRIVTNTALDLLRSKKRKLTESLDAELSKDGNQFKKEIDSKTLSPENELINKINKELILEAVNMLNDNYRTMIVLREFNDYSYEEIAVITNTALGTVKSRIARAREKLKTILIEKLELKNKKNVF